MNKEVKKIDDGIWAVRNEEGWAIVVARDKADFMTDEKTVEIGVAGGIEVSNFKREGRQDEMYRSVFSSSFDTERAEAKLVRQIK